jgi:hypothetical protein
MTLKQATLIHECCMDADPYCYMQHYDIGKNDFIMSNFNFNLHIAGCFVILKQSECCKETD